MNELKIFEKAEEYKNWDKLIQHCEILEEFSDYEKESAKRAFQFLKKELGESFLENLFDRKHPLSDYIYNFAPWTRKWIIWFAESLKELKEKENYSSLLNRIKDKDKFNEGLSILEIANKFFKAGFEIVIDPPINIQGDLKIPDLKITNVDTKEDMYVEVSVVEESAIVKNALNTMNRIFEPLWHTVPYIHYCGRIHKILSERHLQDIITEIKKIVEKVRMEDTFYAFIKEDVIELGITTEKDKQFLEKWAAERDLKPGEFLGPSYNVDEVFRARRKVRVEQEQLPQECPNILIVRNNSIFFPIRDIRKVISELEEEVYNYSHLLFVVISGGYLGGRGEDETIMKDQHVFIKKNEADLLVEQHILLLNRYCTPKISPSCITKIYNAFRNY